MTYVCYYPSSSLYSLVFVILSISSCLLSYLSVVVPSYPFLPACLILSYLFVIFFLPCYIYIIVCLLSCLSVLFLSICYFLVLPVCHYLCFIYSCLLLSVYVFCLSYLFVLFFHLLIICLSIINYPCSHVNDMLWLALHTEGI